MYKKRRKFRRNYRRKVGYTRRPTKYQMVRPGASLSSPGVFPKNLRAKFTYNQTVEMSTLQGAAAVQIFRGNSCYDPDQSGTGHQPPGFDEMSTYYNAYNAYASKIIVTINTTATVPFYAVLTPFWAAATSNMSWDTVQAYPGCKHKVINNLYTGGKNYISAFSNSTKELQLATSTAGLWAAFNANPSNQWYWVFFIEPVDGATVATMIVSFKIIYYCLFKERKFLINS